eukprot:COSAG01_NODE_68_length_28978_cov_182.027777_14_plen_66_part_00
MRLAWPGRAERDGLHAARVDTPRLPRMPYIGEASPHLPEKFTVRMSTANVRRGNRKRACVGAHIG